MTSNSIRTCILAVALVALAPVASYADGQFKWYFAADDHRAANHAGAADPGLSHAANWRAKLLELSAGNRCSSIARAPLVKVTK
jgi:hypothetical protein